MSFVIQAQGCRFEAPETLLRLSSKRFVIYNAMLCDWLSSSLLYTVPGASSAICGEGESVAEIMTQAVVTFDHLTGEIHKNEKTDFHFFISPIDAKSIGDRLQRCRHFYIHQIPRKGGMFARRPCWRV